MKTEQSDRGRSGTAAARDGAPDGPMSTKDREEDAASAVARHLSWRLGDSKGEGSVSLPPDAEDDALYMEAQGDTLVVAGDIDLHQVAEFRKRAEEHVDASAQPRLDLSRVPFLDSAGLATLLALSRQAKSQGKALRLIVTGSPRRVLRITGIDRVLVLED